MIFILLFESKLRGLNYDISFSYLRLKLSRIRLAILSLVACLYCSKLDKKIEMLISVFLDTEGILIALSLKSQLKGLEYGVSFDPVR